MRTQTGAKQTRGKGRAGKPDDDNRDLWEAYKKQPTIETRNRLIEAYKPIVDYEAEDIAASLGYALTADELKGAGVLGLIDSINAFKPEKGFRFITFCTHRVRGAILDELRARDWVPRATRIKLNKLERAMKALETELGFPPSHAQIARRMGISEADVQNLFIDRERAIVSIDRSWGDHDDGDDNIDPAAVLLEDKREPHPGDILQKQEMIELARGMLSETERLVITLYYYEQLNLREIGEVLSLTESRISQIHSEIIRRLRRQLTRRASA